MDIYSLNWHFMLDFFCTSNEVSTALHNKQANKFRRWQEGPQNYLFVTRPKQHRVVTSVTFFSLLKGCHWSELLPNVIPGSRRRVISFLSEICKSSFSLFFLGLVRKPETLIFFFYAQSMSLMSSPLSPTHTHTIRNAHEYTWEVRKQKCKNEIIANLLFQSWLFPWAVQSLSTMTRLSSRRKCHT